MPQFDLVALGIDDPGKLSILGVVDLLEDVASLFLENLDKTVKVVDTIVDHERCIAWGELLAFRRSDQPGRGSTGGFAFRITPVESCATPCLNVDAEVTLVPGLQGRRVFGLEEDAADASNSLHFDLQIGGCSGRLDSALRMTWMTSLRRSFALSHPDHPGRVSNVVKLGDFACGVELPEVPVVRERVAPALIRGLGDEHEDLVAAVKEGMRFEADDL